MTRSIQLIVYPAGDIEKAKTFFNQYLGTEPYVDGAYYVGYRVGDMEIGLDPNSSVAPIGYVHVEDIKASLKELVQAGGEIVKDVTDVGGGLLIAQIKEANGNTLGLRQKPQN